MKWEYPELEIPPWIAKEHNKLAEANKGNIATLNSMKFIRLLLDRAVVYNQSFVKLQGRLDKDKVRFQDMPGAISGTVRNFAESCVTICNDGIRKYDSGLVMAYHTGRPVPAPEAVQNLMVDFAHAGLIGAPATFTKNQAQAVLRLPEMVQTALGIDKMKVFTQAHPGRVKKIKMYEAYLDLWGKAHSHFVAMYTYEYIGPIPEAPRPSFPGSDDEPTVVPWNETTHTIEAA